MARQGHQGHPLVGDGPTGRRSFILKAGGAAEEWADEEEAIKELVFEEET